MKRRISRWIDERFPAKAALESALREEVPGGDKFAYVLGSSTLFLFLLQAVTGVWQMLYYVPTLDHAYESVSYFRLKVPFGWLIHGLHFWGAQAFIVLIGVHVVRVFVWGAYKKPRELTWLFGVLLILMAAGMIFTGALLPWDTLGYWAGEVGTSIAGTTPGIGHYLQSLLRGGETMGQLTLSRFFVFHIAIIPGLAGLVIVLHLIAFRQFGSVGPWDPEKRKRIGWFWPEQAFKDLLAILFVLVLLIGLCAYWPAPVGGPVDPLDTTYTPKPEWNFLFLYQALKVFSGPWEEVGTVGLPLVLISLLVLLPFLDRREERNPRRRPVAMVAGFIYFAAILGLTLVGNYSHPESSSSVGPPSAGREKVARPAPATAAPEPAEAHPVPSSQAIHAGEDLFAANGCVACHNINGQGGVLGPDLSNEGRKGRSRQWLATQLRDPKSFNANSIMPGFASLTGQQVNQLIDYLSSLTAAAASQPASARAPEQATYFVANMQRIPGPAASMIGSTSHGQLLYEQYCLSCHGQDGGGQMPSTGFDGGMAPRLNPIDPRLFNPDPQTFAENVDRFIKHGAGPGGAAPQGSMPAFGGTNSLSQPQIANIEAYVLKLNAVDRAKILNPGVPPERFFQLTLAAFLLAGVLLFGLRWVWRK